MSKTSQFKMGLALGVSVSLFLQLFTVFEADAGVKTAKQNGDINGDGRVDISDAISLLNYLFSGGEPPVQIDCGPVTPPPAKFRFFNDLNCNGQGLLAQFDLCGGISIARLTNQSITDCQAVEPNASCPVKASGSSVCGGFEICDQFKLAPGFVYDFVLTVDFGSPALYLFVNPLQADGSCPDFPVPGTQPTQVLNVACAGARGAVGPAGGSWSSAVGW